jgi:hypothetical protein
VLNSAPRHEDECCRDACHGRETFTNPQDVETCVTKGTAEKKNFNGPGTIFCPALAMEGGGEGMKTFEDFRYGSTHY